MSVSRTKAAAAANEDKDIADIIAAINNGTPTGQKLKDSFKAKFGTDIASAKERKGRSRSTHYDFLVVLSNGEEKRVEHKGSVSRTKGDDSDAPWRAGVQFFNGGAEKYSICQAYARVWYDLYIASSALRVEFGLLAPTPSFEDFFQKDCRVQDDPTTPFGKELKEKVRALRGPKASLLEKREAVNNRLDLSEGVLATLKDEMSAIVNSVLSEKDCWLTIHGSLDDPASFDCAWYPPFSLAITSVTAEKTDKDIWFTFSADNGSSCQGILRWGKGAGFSNLRLDAR
jgi:hypothetical protein